jgi:SAM-dependent methyltransferase
MRAVTSADAGLYDAPTLRFYSDEAPIYATRGPGRASRHLAGFLTRLRPASRIRELGCGGGRDTEAMIQRGFVVDATDGSAAMARKAEQRTGRGVRVMRFDQLDAVEAYDGIWAHASLLHVPRSALPRMLELVYRALRPGGFHFANFKTGSSEGRDRFGRYFNYVATTHLLELYRAAAPWEVVATDEYVGGGYDGHQIAWAAITVRKPR